MAMSLTLSSLTKTPKLRPSRTPKSTTTIKNLLLSTTTLNLPQLSTKPTSFSLFFTKPSLNPDRPNFQTPRRSTVRSLFTGIVEEMGEVRRVGPAPDGGFDLKVQSTTILADVRLGDSISVNGTCLTVTEFSDTDFTVGLSPETLRKTSLVELQPGSLVNLERAMQPTGRMGGHFVQGHVDGTGEIVSRDAEGDSLWVRVKVDKGLLRYIVPKGFIAVDGTSLTVVDVFDDEGCFNFMLVDYTQRKVIIPLKKVGQKVNLEVDILGKYVERLLNSGFADSIKSS